MKTATDVGFDFVQQLAVELADNNFEIPPFPDTALRIQDALKDPDVSVEKLSSIVLSEPMLTARLLRLANSAMMQRGPIEVTDIKTAISRIGLAMVQNVAISLATSEVFKASGNSQLSSQLKKTRKHSNKVCALAYVLARNVNCSGNPDEAMLAGLLHAIGKFYILSRTNDFPELLADQDSLEDLLSEWHTGVGRAIVESWGFPEQIANAVDEYELLDRDHVGRADIADIVIIANLLARADEGEDIELAELDELPSLSRMNTNSEAIQDMLVTSGDEISSMTSALAG